MYAASRYYLYSHAMPVYVGLLRAVNIGPHNKVAMADLRQLMVTLGLEDGQTLLQSGNAVFRSDVKSSSKLEGVLQEGAEKHLRLKIEFFVRSAKEWEGIIAENPFPTEALRDPGHLILMCLRDAVDRAAVGALQSSITGREVVQGNGRQAYMVFPDGQGTSRVTTAVIERKLATRVTGRNWNTVLKLDALARTLLR